jgi:hypothetical protein
MDVTIRAVDERAFRRFKARAAELDLRLGEALTLAIREWAKRDASTAKRPSLLASLPVDDWGPGSEHLSEDIDRILYGGGSP